MSTQAHRLLHNPGNEFERLQREYLQSMILRNCSERTIEYWAMNLLKFNRWCEARAIEQVTDLDINVLKAYRQHLFHYRNERNGQPLKFATQHAYLIVLRRWCTWLHEQKKTPTNIGLDFEIPKPENRLPTDVLTADEVERIMNQTDTTMPIGIRDRAIIETLYSTGIRNSELTHLQLYDIDEERKVVVVRQGKGKKDRVIPIGERALKWINKYVADVRPELVAQAEPHPILFVYANGHQIHRSNLSHIVRTYVEKAGITKPGSCHLLRHTAATLMMENGADLRSLQQYLGHAKLTTTQIYTHVSIGRLQEVHKRTHPSSWKTAERPTESEQPEAACQPEQR